MPLRVISRFFMENLLPHSTEVFRRGTLLCFTKIPLSKKFMDKKLGGGSRDGVSRFSVKNFGHTVPNTSVGEPFCAVFHLFSGCQKMMDKKERGGSIKIFLRKLFVSQCLKVS